MFSSDTLPAYSQRVFSFSLIESRVIESAISDSGGAFLNFSGKHGHGALPFPWKNFLPIYSLPGIFVISKFAQYSASYLFTC